MSVGLAILVGVQLENLGFSSALALMVSDDVFLSLVTLGCCICSDL